MATRARIGIQQKSGRIIASYQHWDGYPGGLGFNLIENWEDPKKVTEAIKLGDSSKWHQIIGDKVDFDDRDNQMYEVQNVYYGRDRGEKNTPPNTQSPHLILQKKQHKRTSSNSIYLILKKQKKCPHRSI